MSLFNELVKKYHSDGVESLVHSLFPFIQNRLQLKRLVDLHSIFKISNTYDIYSHEWDLMIIVDACRYDLMTSVSDEYEFISELSYKYSPASSSKEWMEAQFSQSDTKRTEQTTYITGNTFSNEELSSDQFKLLDEVWRYGWDSDLGTIPPRVVTDRAITVGRHQNPDRMLVHYMQPHFPALNNPQLGGEIDPVENCWINSVWNELSNGELKYETVWQAYKSNVHMVLSEIRLLLRNSSFQTVIITSDHGNGFGENNIYGHPGDRIHECLRKVPWIKTHASDTEGYTPKEYNIDSGTNSVENKLASLGYV